ncbi:DNA helicase UvrD [candidate division WOR-3 bacterium]|nr:DNA helicase UvrD [candidate division WOR-3 bacterium]
MKFIADLHIHSRYSRATSKEMDIPMIARYAEKKGIGLVASGDFTHPAYRQSLAENLEPVGNGLFRHGDTHFILNVEVNNIYSAHGRLRRLHNLLFVPSLETAEAVAGFLGKYGKLESDGRPTLSISSYEMLARLLETDEEAFLVPAHIWTPWFSLYGSNSGFDTIEECFGDLSDHIFAVETGLSSDPPMNWRLSALDSRTLVSNSDAHSPSRLGREANVFDCELSFRGVKDALRTGDRNRFLYTIEFFPEEGKYHYDGHRACGVCLAPEEAALNNDLCPVCGRKLTVGVLHRVMELADRKPDEVPQDRIPYRSLVPLEEVVSEAVGKGRDTQSVQAVYGRLVEELGSEFEVLLEASPDEIARHSDERVAEGVDRMRQGRVEKKPGFDGVFGVISVLPGSNKTAEDDATVPESGQLGLF